MEEELFSCGICTEKYNENEKTPYTLIPCAHDFCIECIGKLKQSPCPMCRKKINDKVINRGILRHLSLNLVKDPNGELKKSINKSREDLEEQLTSKINNKKTKNTVKLDVIKKEINDQSTKLLELIELNKYSLLKELKKNESISNSRIDDYFKSLKDKNDILIKQDLKDLNKNDLLKYYEMLQEKLKSLDTDIDLIDDYDSKIRLQLNNIQPTENLIGELTVLNDSEAYYCKGNSLNDLERYQEAIDCYSTAIQLNSNYVEAFCCKANSLFNLNKFQEAIDCYHKAIQLNPSYLEAFNNQGFLFHKLKKFKEAIECYDNAIKLDPTNSLIFSNKGLSLNGLKRYQEAIDCYDNAIKLDSTNPIIYHNKGLSLNDLKRYQEAIDCYSTAIQLNPNYAEAFYCAGNSFNDLNICHEASHCYEKAIKLNPNYTEAYDALSNLNIKRLKI